MKPVTIVTQTHPGIPAKEMNVPIEYPVVNVLAAGARGGTQSNDDKLDLLGRFASVGNIRSMLGTKLLVNQQTGDFTIQDSGFKTWWARSAADSLKNPAVHDHVTRVFDSARRQRNMLWDEGSCLAKIQRIQYAFKGYSSLVRLGYSGEKILKKQVKGIATIVRDIAPVPYLHKLSQTNWLPDEHEGACWAFVLDWLRRGFKEKYSYAGAKIGKKMNAIMALQEDQLIKDHTSRIRQAVGIDEPMGLVDPTRPTPSQNAYQGSYVTRAGHAAQRFNSRFDGMMYHSDRWFPIDPQERRCYGVRAPGDATVPRPIGSEILNYLKIDRIKSLLSESQSGWMLVLSFRDFFSDAVSSGHAVGIRFSPGRRGIMFFDPNYGTGEMPFNTGYLWINHLIQEYSFRYAVESVSVRRVSVT